MKRDSKVNRHHWEKDSRDLEIMAFDIMKDLEYNYRLPENLITILTRILKSFLSNYKIEFDYEIIKKFGNEVEEILCKFDKTQEYATINLLENALSLAISKTVVLRLSNLAFSWKKYNSTLITMASNNSNLSGAAITAWIHDLENYLPIIKFQLDKEVIPHFEKELKKVFLYNDKTSKELKIELLEKAFEVVLKKTYEIFQTKLSFYCQDAKNIIEEYIKYSTKQYVAEGDKNKFLINPESHFEYGHFLHSTQYYFAKRYFQNSVNCDKLALLLANKVINLKLVNITLVGFKGYTGMLLQKTKKLFESTGLKIDYVIIEPLENNKFTWQFQPDFEKINRNFLIVLPITSSCLNYVRIQKYLKREIDNYQSQKVHEKNGKSKEDWQISRSFINIFLIQDNRLRDLKGRIYVNKEVLKNLPSIENREASNIETELSLLYSDFNWERIEDKAIYFKEKTIQIDKNKFRDSYYIGHTIIKLYSDLTVPEECPSCFPKEDLKREKNMVVTHDNFETPNLIQDFPNFGKERPPSQNLDSLKSHVARTDLIFTKLFASDTLKGVSHHYGHIKVNGSSYLNYIYGNTFFEHNRTYILEYFDEVLKEIIIEKPPLRYIKDIVFITSESKHNSTFLDEILAYKPKTGIGAISLWKKLRYNNGIISNISILRIDSQNEFIDNFMSNYFNLLNDKRTLIVYFEEVFSAGKTFKLLSNYLKHYKNIAHEEKELRHGFDYVFSLIDRTPYHTKEEILKKLYSKENEIAVVNRFITFFKLNVPIVSAAHLGNPLDENVNLLKQMVTESHLDILKKRIGSELPNKMAYTLATYNSENSHNLNLKYYPFEDSEGKISEDDYLKHRNVLKNGKIELLKLYVAHEINSILSANRKEGETKSELEKIAENNDLVKTIVERIVTLIQETKESFFTSIEIGENYLLSKEEIDVIHDTVLKILSRHPFTYYIKIYESVFKYCLSKLDEIINDILEIKERPIPSYSEIRKIKFYVRRLVDLDSSFLISPRFIKLIQFLYEERLSNGLNRVESLLKKIEIELEIEIEDYIINPFYGVIEVLKNTDEKIDYLPALSNLNYFISRLLLINRSDLILNNAKLIKDKFNIETGETQDNSEVITQLIKAIQSKIYNDGVKSTYEHNSIKETRINNLIYKTNSLNSLPSLLIYSFKELIFKNHYRSIKLEGLLNEPNQLPKLLTDINNDIEKILSQIKEQYYQITGVINAENLYLLNKLKELHKWNFNNYYWEELRIIRNGSLTDEIKVDLIEKEQKKWLNPYLGSKICDYYFGKLKSTPIASSYKNDPIIINANKFIERSRYKDDALRLDSIKLAVSNMLRASTFFDVKEKYLSNKNIKSFGDLISEINEKLQFVTSILQPGLEQEDCVIGTSNSKLGYALCIKFSNESLSQDLASNIFVISSDKFSNGAKISKKGLIYKLLNGIYTSKERCYIDYDINDKFAEKLINEQSLLTGIKVNKKWESFNGSYYHYPENQDDPCINLEPEVFSDLMQYDCKSKNIESGLHLLSKANMSLFFRLSELNIPLLNMGKCELEGKAVLIITCNDYFDRDNYLQFMSNEKVRLLLLIKEEFMKYIQSKVESDAFIELLKKREQVEFAETMEHGISRYFNVIDYLMDNGDWDSNKITILKFINKILYSQFSEISNSNRNISFSSNEKITLTKTDITSMFKLIMSLPHLDRRTLMEDEYTFDISVDNLECSQSIYSIVLPEIFINMRRHSLNVAGVKEFKIFYLGASVVFANSFDPITNPFPEKEKEKGGKAMCKKILGTQAIYEEHVDIDNSIYAVKLTFKN